MRAFQQLAAEDAVARQQMRLVIVGDGPAREQCLDLLHDAGLSRQAWLPGARDDIAALMRAFDVFVLPSLAEGASNTILEAMATGLPVLATVVGGSPELGGYVGDLADYDAELLAAHDVIAQDLGGQDAGWADHPLILMAHSTGGLTATLWAHHFPGRVSQLILNSPWLELQGGAAIRRAATPLVQLAELRPLMRMRVPERSFYWRGISSDAYGEWQVDKALRPPQAFPVRAGWMRAILAAQQEVAAGLKLPMPVLVLLSSRSMLGPVWSDDMLRADVVLDVRALALRTLSLGDSVSLERIDGALHEVFLSSPPVREEAYARLERWLRGYVD